MNFPFIQQNNVLESGMTCLAMIFKHYGLYNSRHLFNQLSDADTQGCTLYLLQQISEMFGFKTDNYQTNYENLEKLSFPCVAHYQGSHFVVIYGYSAKSVEVANPLSNGKETISKEEFLKLWNGSIVTFKATKDLKSNQNALELAAKHKIHYKDVVKHYYYDILYNMRGLGIQLLLATFTLEFLSLALPFFTQIIVDKAIVYQNRKLLFAVLAGMLLVLVAQVTLTHARNTLLAQFKAQFEFDFFSRFFEHFIHLRQKFFDQNKREDLINRFKESAYIRQALSPSSAQATMETVMMFIYSVVLYLYHPFLAFIANFFMVACLVSLFVISQKRNVFIDKIFTENGKSMGEFIDALSGIQNLKLLSVEHIRMWRWGSQYRKNMNVVLDLEYLDNFLVTMMRTSYFTSLVAVYWYGAYLTFENEMTIGQYVAFNSIFFFIMNNLNKTIILATVFGQLKMILKKLNEILIQPREEQDLQLEQTEIIKPTITLDKVSFGYVNKYAAEEKKLILDNISLTIPYGNYVGIVGRNGSGKTTFVKLLAKLYDDFEGTISLNGIPIQKLHTYFYRRKVVTIPQQVHIFNDTIKNNILYGNPEATMEQVIEAAKLADIHDYIISNTLNYNTRVGESGVKLSGGQQLKIAFARLFLMNPEIIILDEASSALDVETEQKIIYNLQRHFKGKTIISIAHRLNTLVSADMLLVIDKGKLVEQGTHAELIGKDGIYAQFMKTYVNF
jgi:ATP-binding cassette subfamily B protein